MCEFTFINLIRVIISYRRKDRRNKGMERPRRNYLDIKKEVAVGSYQELRVRVLDRHG